jgi:hypothetical protein
MAINISPEDTKLFENNGYDYSSVKSTVDHYRQQGLSDDEIQGKIDIQLQNFKQMPTEMIPPSDTLTLQGGVSNTPDEQPQETLGHKVGNFALNALPVAGAIGGGILGEGVASLPFAAGGAALGESAKQGIKNLMGEQKGIDPLSIAREAGTALLGEGIGKVGGLAYKGLAPAFGKALAGIPQESYRGILNAIEQGRNPFTTSLKKAGQSVGKEAKNLAKLTEIPLDQAQNILEETLNKFGGSRINTVNSKTQKLQKDINTLLEQSAWETGTVNLQDIYKIKKMLQEGSNYNKIDNKEIQRFIKNLATNFNKPLREASPAYSKANQTYIDALSAQQFRKPGYISGNLFSLPTELTVKQPMFHQIPPNLYRLLRGSGVGGGAGAGVGSLYNNALGE